MFVDASAVVAILAREVDAEELRQKLKSRKQRLISAIALFEASLAVRRLRDFTPVESYETVVEFAKIFTIKHVDIEPRVGELAIHAFERYGKGQGHKARLNMGDCFAYACAKVHRVPLLCKGDDFVHTDIELA